VIFRKLSDILLKREKSQFFKLMLAILIMGLLEVVGVASILPFMELIASPDAIQQNPFLLKVYEFLGFESEREMLVYSGVLVILLITFSNTFSVLTTWFQYKFSWGLAHSFSVRLLTNYLNKPYSYFLNKNTSELQAYLIGEVGTLTAGVILPIIDLASCITVALVIFSLLVIINPGIALSTLFVLGGIYLVIYLLRQKYIKQLGESRIVYNVKRYGSLTELLSGIKTIKTYSSQDYFFNRFSEASDMFTKIMPRFNIVMLAPKYILEIFAFGGILGITLFLFMRSGNIQQTLPILSLYAVAGYRLLPALQKAFAAITKLRHNYPVLDKLYDDLVKSIEYAEQEPKPTYSLPFERELVIDRITFAYEENSQPLFDDFSVRIPKGKVIAFVGSTGSGKTTLVDIIVGLLQPQSGHIKLDDTALSDENIESWRKKMTYVPQQVFLFDDSILRNIVMDVEPENVDQQKLEQACRMASIYDFVNEELPNGFATVIGERGVRLSGGQKQRLGLARALYRNPHVLILDEATSSLDNITEKSIVESLDNLPEDLTLIIIAHRLSSVRRADCIYFLSDGKIMASGTYDELLESSETFRTMVELS
jgi:ATP-binding cassette subfamily C protein